MLYAILSDMHGNCPALRAALDDACDLGADYYLFLGDYYRDFPWQNEVIQTIRRIPNALIIGGNNEGYLSETGEWLRNTPPCGQFSLMHWNFANLTADNLNYLKSLPQSARIDDGDHEIRMEHILDIFIRNPIIPQFHSTFFRKIMKDVKMSRVEYLSVAGDALLNRSDALADIRALPEGIYLFGHNHLQFHIEYEGRLFIDPGSCGVSLNGDTRASYTLLDTDSISPRVTERAVSYDVDAVASEYKNSDFFNEVPFWPQVLLRQLLTGYDHFGSFVRHIMLTGKRQGETSRTVSDATFKIACDTWDPDELYLE